MGHTFSMHTLSSIIYPIGWISIFAFYNDFVSWRTTLCSCVLSACADCDLTQITGTLCQITGHCQTVSGVSAWLSKVAAVAMVRASCLSCRGCRGRNLHTEEHDVDRRNHRKLARWPKITENLDSPWFEKCTNYCTHQEYPNPQIKDLIMYFSVGLRPPHGVPYL